jgi:hypothetical protein
MLFLEFWTWLKSNFCCSWLHWRIPSRSHALVLSTWLQIILIDYFTIPILFLPIPNETKHWYLMQFGDFLAPSLFLVMEFVDVLQKKLFYIVELCVELRLCKQYMQEQ